MPELEEISPVAPAIIAPSDPAAGFPGRFREAFDHATNADIARRLQTSDATIKPYTDGTRLPVPDMLLRITRTTGVNLHWLLTGEGPRRVDRSRMFTDEEEATIAAQARAAGRTFDEQVRELALAAAEFKTRLD